MKVSKNCCFAVIAIASVLLGFSSCSSTKLITKNELPKMTETDGFLVVQLECNKKDDCSLVLWNTSDIKEERINSYAKTVKSVRLDSGKNLYLYKIPAGEYAFKYFKVGNKINLAMETVPIKVAVGEIVYVGDFNIEIIDGNYLKPTGNYSVKSNFDSCKVRLQKEFSQIAAKYKIIDGSCNYTGEKKAMSRINFITKIISPTSQILSDGHFAYPLPPKYQISVDYAEMGYQYVANKSVAFPLENRWLLDSFTALCVGLEALTFDSDTQSETEHNFDILMSLGSRYYSLPLNEDNSWGFYSSGYPLYKESLNDCLDKNFKWNIAYECGLSFMLSPAKMLDIAIGMSENDIISSTNSEDYLDNTNFFISAKVGHGKAQQ
ncbi:MAG: hypothetical protein BKP49_04335 [Treponema sp. CETP13]|nr:MAG: hypothetical protein BKP49_04335 [Treponema sp. CETP13]